MALISKQPVFNSTTGASDVQLSGGLLFISGADATGDSFDQMVYNNISTGNEGILKSLQESAYVASVAFTAANSTSYKFSINQQVGDEYITKVFQYTSDSTATAAEIATAFVTAINNDGNLQLTASGSGTPITITADAGYPLFNVTDISNTTTTSGMATYAPNGTAANAITNVIAPDGTAATAIAGTDTVTVTTLAAHLLEEGDIVTIGSVATMVLAYESGGKVFTGQAGGTFRVDTVPSSTTFTLEGVTASGTNSGTITITSVNNAFVQTLAAQTSIVAGKQLSIAGVATATLDGGTSGTYRVGAVLTGDQRFKLEGATLVGINSGTITITLKESASRGLGSVLDAAGVAGADTSDTYSQVVFNYSSPATPDFGVASRGTAKEQTAYFSEADANTPALLYALDKALGGVLYYTPELADPAGQAKI